MNPTLYGPPIPMDVFRPILTNYVDNFETNEIPADEEGMSWPLRAPSPIAILAAEAGFERDTLQRILQQGKRKTIGLYQADALLAAMGLTHLWYVEPLWEHYQLVVPQREMAMAA